MFPVRTTTAEGDYGAIGGQNNERDDAVMTRQRTGKSEWKEGGCFDLVMTLPRADNRDPVPCHIVYTRFETETKPTKMQQRSIYHRNLGNDFGDGKKGEDDFCKKK